MTRDAVELERVSRDMLAALRAMLAPSEDRRPTVYAPIVAQAREAMKAAMEYFGQ